MIPRVTFRDSFVTGQRRQVRWCQTLLQLPTLWYIIGVACSVHIMDSRSSLRGTNLPVTIAQYLIRIASSPISTNQPGIRFGTRAVSPSRNMCRQQARCFLLRTQRGGDRNPGSRKGLQQARRHSLGIRNPFANCRKRLSSIAIGTARKWLFGAERCVARRTMLVPIHAELGQDVKRVCLMEPLI